MRSIAVNPTGLMHIACEETSYLVFPPVACGPVSAQDSVVDDSSMPPDSLDQAMSFEWWCSVVGTGPLSPLEVAWMGKEEFLSYMVRAKAKVSNVEFLQGIGAFSTDFVKGFVGLGASPEAHEVECFCWNSDGTLAQGVVVRGKSRKAALDAAASFLACMKYAAEDVPPSGELGSAVAEAVTREFPTGSGVQVDVPSGALDGGRTRSTKMRQ